LQAKDGFELVALFGPEHGVRGEAQAGAEVNGAIDNRTGLPVYSLFGETRTSTRLSSISRMPGFGFTPTCPR
jgi:uncharacterized protein YbbC (DUF1343 family)